MLIIEYNRFGDQNLPMNVKLKLTFSYRCSVKYTINSCYSIEYVQKNKIKLETKDLKKEKKKENKILVYRVKILLLFGI